MLALSSSPGLTGGGFASKVLHESILALRTVPVRSAKLSPAERQAYLRVGLTSDWCEYMLARKIHSASLRRIQRDAPSALPRNSGPDRV